MTISSDRIANEVAPERDQRIPGHGNHHDPGASSRAVHDPYADAELQRRHERTQVMIKKAHEQLH